MSKYTKKLHALKHETYEIPSVVVGMSGIDGMDKILLSKKTRGNYIIYKADTREEAEAFLKTIKNIPRMTYHVVETPNGNIGKDCLGIYDEPTQDDPNLIKKIFSDR